ncbi:MAG: NADH-quinone oxidoreductase subunit NuoH [Planctomycetes bacterium]|nr:NADH-quinone oxidoreductase subunit NuoH [Planctomycetota bacterium]
MLTFDPAIGFSSAVLAVQSAESGLKDGFGTNAIQDFLVGVKPEYVPAWAVPLTAIGIAIGIVLAIVSVLAMFSTWLERKVSGHIQCRFGPMRVGWHGWLQPLADGVKLLLKEDMIPLGADRTLYVIAPALVLASLLGAMAAFPLTETFYFANFGLGIFMILALTSTTTIGVVMAGWSSNSKWSLYGAMREAAQVVAYEIPLGISLLVPIMVAGSFNLIEVSQGQGGGYGILNWNIWPWVNPFMLPAFVLFFVAILAETKRAPFDLPEAESELVAGFMTEYSGIRWSFFFMEEYAAMFLYCVVGSFFFFGGFESPVTSLAESVGGTNSLLHQLGAASTIVLKGFAGVFLMMWLRWTLPRVRIDQVMTMGYKYLTPLALVCVLGAGLWEAFIAPHLWWRS